MYHTIFIVLKIQPRIIMVILLHGHYPIHITRQNNTIHAYIRYISVTDNLLLIYVPIF